MRYQVVFGRAPTKGRWWAVTEFAMRDGLKVAYETAGAGEPPIVFVHGWSCDRSFFAPQVEHFARRHAVVTTDLRGHGDSDQPDPTDDVYRIDDFVGDVLAVATAAGFDRPVVVGHSLGGVIAAACAARPGAVRAAVMVDPAPMVGDRVAFMGAAADACATDENGAIRRAFVEGMFLSTDRVRRDEIVECMSSRPAGIGAAALRSLATFDAAAALSGCEVPLLCIGSASPSNEPSALRALCAHIVIGQTVGSGHFNQLEVPDQVNLMIERFLAVSVLD